MVQMVLIFALLYAYSRGFGLVPHLQIHIGINNPLTFKHCKRGQYKMTLNLNLNRIRCKIVPYADKLLRFIFCTSILFKTIESNLSSDFIQRIGNGSPLETPKCTPQTNQPEQCMCIVHCAHTEESVVNHLLSVSMATLNKRFGHRCYNDTIYIHLNWIRWIRNQSTQPQLNQ